MKSIKEIEAILIEELSSRLNKIKTIKSRYEYYNEFFGDTSFLLAGLLGALMKLRSDWNSNRWFDDSLLKGVNLINNKLSIWGIMIWGIENKTEQWTDPFYFEIEMTDSKSDSVEYAFLFGDLNNSEISYEDFKMNRNYWENNDRDWKYVINGSNGDFPISDN